MNARRILVLSALLCVAAAAFAGGHENDLTQPHGPIDDRAGLFSPESRKRLERRVNQINSNGLPRGTPPPVFVGLLVYTLESAPRLSPDQTIEALYRRWREVAVAEGTYFEREVIVFLFPRERVARAVAGRELSAGVLEGVRGIEPDLPSFFSGDPEQALLRVLDSLAGRVHIPATYHEPPPPPAGSGPVFGRWTKQDGDQKEIAASLAAASREASHPMVLVQDPELNYYTPRDRTEQLAAAWPGRTILLLSRYPTDSLDVVALVRPADQARSRFPAESVTRIERELIAASAGPDLDRTLTRTIAEIGTLAAGHQLRTWNPLLHPVQAMTGGRDASRDTRIGLVLLVVFIVIVVILTLAWIGYFIRKPREAALGLVLSAVGILIDSGGSGNSGSDGGFSGGGGGFGGGGATGSW